MHVLRPALISDAKELAQLQERTFRDAFEEANNPEDMALHCAKSYGEAIQRQEILNPQITTLICTEDDVQIGFVQLRQGEIPAYLNTQQALEIQRFYVDKPWHGKGVAQDLMAQSIEFAKKLGADQIWLGVWEKNPRAISFYSKFGFIEVGEHIFTVGADAQRDLIFSKRLS